MLTLKEKVKNLIDELPDDATLDDIEYHLYVRKKIERSREAVRQGKLTTHEDAKKKFREWKKNRSPGFKTTTGTL